MKKFDKTGLLIISLIIVTIMACGCSSTFERNAVEDGKLGYYNAEEDLNKSAELNSQSSATTEQITSNRKIIEYVTLTVETKTFDKLIDDINSAVKKSGGYIESSEIGGNSYYGTDSRVAQLKIRIPKAKQSDFSDFMSENSNVVNRSVSTDDVTDQYIDTQSRIKALTLEKETLEKLLTQASDMSDTLTVYERLTSVIAEIESYQGRLNQMDNLIDYTTFTLYIDEVEKETNVQKQNWFTKTWNDLSDNFSDVGNGILAFLSFLVASLPYLILIAAIALIVLLAIRRIRNKGKKNTEDKCE